MHVGGVDEALGFDAVQTKASCVPLTCPGLRAARRHPQSGSCWTMLFKLFTLQLRCYTRTTYRTPFSGYRWEDVTRQRFNVNINRYPTSFVKKYKLVNQPFPYRSIRSLYRLHSSKCIDIIVTLEIRTESESMWKKGPSLGWCEVNVHLDLALIFFRFLFNLHQYPSRLDVYNTHAESPTFAFFSSSTILKTKL